MHEVVVQPERQRDRRDGSARFGAGGQYLRLERRAMPAALLRIDVHRCPANLDGRHGLRLGL